MTIGFVVVIDILYQGDYFFPLSPKRRRILSHYYRIIIVVVFCTYRLVDWWSSHCVQRGRLIECSVTSQLYDMQSDFMYILNDATQVVQSSLYHKLSEAWNDTAFLMFLQLYNDAEKQWQLWTLTLTYPIFTTSNIEGLICLKDLMANPAKAFSWSAVLQCQWTSPHRVTLAKRSHHENKFHQSKSVNDRRVIYKQIRVCTLSSTCLYNEGNDLIVNHVFTCDFV